jgi:hypothetical protein
LTAANAQRSFAQLRSRFVNRGSLEVWGRIKAPDGTSVILRIAGPGRPASRLGEAPVAAGRFYAKARVPASLRGRSVRITARVAG